MAALTAATMLRRHKLRLTGNRMGVLQVLQQAGHPLSLAELESRLPAMDRITMYRTLQCFRENSLLHIIADPGSGNIKYMFSDPDTPKNHAHFKCSTCRKIMCLDTMILPANAFNLPEGLDAVSYSLMIEGRCTKCKQ